MTNSESLMKSREHPIIFCDPVLLPGEAEYPEPTDGDSYVHATLAMLDEQGERGDAILLGRAWKARGSADAAAWYIANGKFKGPYFGRKYNTRVVEHPEHPGYYTVKIWM